jgi:hypothetical protein
VGIVYPGAIDSFTTPSDPENTPLSEAGDASRNHTESIHDQGLAIEQLETLASKVTHDHSGSTTDTTKGPKLNQVNTHQSADTDSSPTAIHHSLGTGANQAAAGNHIHDYSVITNTPYRVVTSTTHPSSPFLGEMIFETDTNFFRVWSTIGGTTAWHIMPGMLVVPLVRAQQTTIQTLTQGGSLINFQQELEDTNNFFNPSVSMTDFTINEPGVYHIDGSMQWSTNYCPDTSFVILTQNGINTTLREHRATRGDNQGGPPGFSQTLAFSGKIRCAANDILRMKADFTASPGLFGLIATFIEFILSGGASQQEKISTRIEISYVSP